VENFQIKTAALMCENHIKTYCVGGLLLENSLVCVGNKAVELARGFNTDIAFISCKGVSDAGKFTDTSEEETAVRRAFMENAGAVAMLMTGNKFERSYLHTLASAQEVDYLFSDAPIPDGIARRLKAKKQVD
jgi:DeoR family glycerol-3-phosphate regulon repressor